jgi:hypothetical protein
VCLWADSLEIEFPEYHSTRFTSLSTFGIESGTSASFLLSFVVWEKTAVSLIATWFLGRFPRNLDGP